MPTTLAQITQQAFVLPPNERAQLAEALLESLQSSPIGEIEAAWESEIKKRVADFNKGQSELISAESVFATARQLVA